MTIENELAVEARDPCHRINQRYLRWLRRLAALERLWSSHTEDLEAPPIGAASRHRCLMQTFRWCFLCGRAFYLIMKMS